MAMVLVVFGAMALCDRRAGMSPWTFSSGACRPDSTECSTFSGRLPPRSSSRRWPGRCSKSARLSQMLNLSTNLIDLPKAWFQWALAAFAGLTALGHPCGRRNWR